MNKLRFIYLIGFLTLFLYSCGKGEGHAPSQDLPASELPSETPPAPLTLQISPVSIAIAINAGHIFSATGGQPPYTFSILSGGGSINASSGAYTAPAAAGSAIVRVADASGNTAQSTVTIQNSTPVISTISAQTVYTDAAKVINYTVSDVDSTLSCQTSITVTSSQTGIIPNTDIAKGGTAPNCTLTINPSLNVQGTTVITISASDGANSSQTTFDAHVQNVSSIAISPSSLTLTLSGTSQLAAQVTYSDSTTSDITTSTNASWSSSNSSSVSVNNSSSKGLVTAASLGSANMTVSYKGVTSSASAITVQNLAPSVSSIANQTVYTDVNKVINYTISDSETSLNCQTSVTVSSSMTSVLPDSDFTKGGTAPNCTITISPSLNVQGVSVVTVSVSDGVNTTQTTFNAGVENVMSVSLTPSSSSLAVSGATQLTAVATLSDFTNRTMTTSSLTTWSSSNSGIASVNNTSSKGVVTGVANGSANISLTYKGVTSSSSAITVLTATSVSVSTGAVSGGIGSQVAVSATAQNGSTSFDVTNTGIWTSSNSSVATVSNGVISYVSAGTATITVTYAGLSASVAVTVYSKSLISIVVSVSSGADSVQVNGTKNMVATATYSDSSTENVTSSATWTSSNTAVATISNSLPYIGRITGVAAGTSTISATVGSISGSLVMTVSGVTLTSIAITPYDPLVASGATYSLRATGTYSDASTADITDLVTWSSSNTSAATISNTSGSKGVATTPTFTGYQSTTISAVLSGVTGTTPFGVNGATVSSILVTPTVTLSAGQTYQLKAYANLSDGGVIDVTSFAIWTSSSVSNVSVSNSLGSQGLVTAVANGTSTVSATFNSISGSRVVTVSGTPALTETGVGLLGSYYNWTGTAPPTSPFLTGNKKGQRIDARVAFAWGAGNAPMGVGDFFSVRWTGFYKATAATNYFCTYSDDGVRVWINGTQVINNWTDHSPTWNCTGNIALTVGTKYSVVIEFYENGGGAEMHFTRSSVSAADARNATTRLIPQSDLYPE